MGYQARDYPGGQNPPQAIHGTTQWRGSLAETMKAAYQQMSGSPIEQVMDAQSFDANRSTYVPPFIAQSRIETYERVLQDYIDWGYTAQEAAEVLTRAFATAAITIVPRPVGDSSDGIAPCGYEEL